MSACNNLGWSPFFENQLSSEDRKEYRFARVIEEQRGMFRVCLPKTDQELRAQVSGRFRHEAMSRIAFPVVGDWVGLSLPSDGTALIHRVLDRRSCLLRKSAGTTAEEQLLAANVDVVLIVNSLNQDLNLRRIERFLALCWSGGAKPVILLSKVDLCEDPELKASEVAKIAPHVDVHFLSAYAGFRFRGCKRCNSKSID